MRFSFTINFWSWLMKIKKSLIVPIFILLLFLQGCKWSKMRENSDGSVTISRGFSDIDIVELNLSDGTKCAALVGVRRGSITCNWK